jgi:hypothetical protein
MIFGSSGSQGDLYLKLASLSQSGSLTSYASIKDLPFAAAFFLDVVAARLSVLTAFVDEWREQICDPQYDGGHADLAAVATLLRTCAWSWRNPTIRCFKISVLVLPWQFNFFFNKKPF